MATNDYAKKKNAELEELLKARGLSTVGKKADMVARLEEDDAAKDAPGSGATGSSEPAAAAAAAAAAPASGAGTTAPAASSAPAPAADASSTPAAAAVAAGGQGRAANPVSVPNQVSGEDPAAEDLTVQPPAPAKDFTSGLASLGLADELARRKARAARFGTALAAGVADTEKSVERAKRFGTGSNGNGNADEGNAAAEGVVRGLNAALPDERSRKRGRGAEKDTKAHHEDGAGGRAQKRQDSTPRDTAPKAKPKPAPAMSEADRAKADARAKRFGAAS